MSLSRPHRCVRVVHLSSLAIISRTNNQHDGWRMAAATARYHGEYIRTIIIFLSLAFSIHRIYLEECHVDYDVDLIIAPPLDCVDIAVEGGCVEIVVDSFIAVGRKCVRNCNLCGFGCRLCCLASSWHHGSRRCRS